MKFEYLEHTADVKFKAFGKDLAEAFANAALATYGIMTEDKVKSRIIKKIKVTSKRKRSLLYDFLEELLFLVDTEAFIGGKVTVKIKEREHDLQLEAEIKGDTADSYDVSTHIKAVTYSDMFIKEEPTRVTIQVVHDI